MKRPGNGYLFDEDDISSFVPIGWITEDQKNEILKQKG